MYELKKNGKVFTSKFVGTGPSSYEKRIHRAAVSQKLRSTGVDRTVTGIGHNMNITTANFWFSWLPTDQERLL